MFADCGLFWGVPILFLLYNNEPDLFDTFVFKIASICQIILGHPVYICYGILIQDWGYNMGIPLKVHHCCGKHMMCFTMFSLVTLF